MAEWDDLKNAALEYAEYRPLLVPEKWVPDVGVVEQLLPDRVIGIEYIDYGDRLSLVEIVTAPETAQGWCIANGYLYLTPAPTSATPISLIWRKQHEPDELTQSFPTISARDMLYVVCLADAGEAEQQQAAIELGLSSYTIGGTTVKWSQQGGGGITGGTLSQRLRSRVIAALQEPVSEWG